MTGPESGSPQRIFLVRHAEKPADDGHGKAAVTPESPGGVDASGQEDGHGLTPRGWQRCGALAVLFAPMLGPVRDGLSVPDHLFCPSYGDPQTTAARRPHQTLLALSARTGVEIESPFGENEEAALAERFLSGRYGTVLVCWEHHRIPDIAAAIPTVPPHAAPTDWPDDRFDLIWAFTRITTDPLAYRFSQLDQKLLAGDTA